MGILPAVSIHSIVVTVGIRIGMSVQYLITHVTQSCVISCELLITD